MARFYHIPKGGKSVKYSGKRKPLLPSTKYKIIAGILFIIVLIETSYIGWILYNG